MVLLFSLICLLYDHFIVIADLAVTINLVDEAIRLTKVALELWSWSLFIFGNFLLCILFIIMLCYFEIKGIHN